MASLQGQPLGITGTPSQVGRYIERCAEGMPRLVLVWQIAIPYPALSGGNYHVESHATTEGAIRALCGRYLRRLGLSTTTTTVRATCGDFDGYRSEDAETAREMPLPERRLNRASKRRAKAKRKK